MDWRNVFATHGYFWNVGQLLIAGGMDFLAKVTITSEDIPYHVPTKFARSTSIFYHLKGMALIVQLKYHEHLGSVTDYYEHHWTIDFFCEESHARWLERLREWPRREGVAGDWESADDIPSAWELLETEGLHGGGGSMGARPTSPGWEVCRKFYFEQERTIRPRRVSPQEVADPIITAAHQVKPTLSDRFYQLYAWSFPPGYVFPGCEPIFWSRFPIRKLRPLARRIVGIKLQPD